MPKALSDDLRKRIVDLYTEGKSVRIIVQRLRVSKSSVYDLLKRYKETGLYHANRSTGRKAILSKEQIDQICKLVSVKPDITLEQIQEKLQLPVCIATICVILKKQGFRRKKRQYMRLSKTALM